MGAKLWDGAEGGAWKQGVTDIEGEVLCGESCVAFPTPLPSALASQSAERKKGLLCVQQLTSVSQFTLFANFKGLKPDFHESMVSYCGTQMELTTVDATGQGVLHIVP